MTYLALARHIGLTVLLLDEICGEVPVFFVVVLDWNAAFFLNDAISMTVTLHSR